MARIWREYGLTIVLVGLFLATIAGQFLTGFYTLNEERALVRLPPLTSHLDYLQSGHFISSVSENLESEFLQMALFVLLTAFLYQKGSAESQPLPEQKTATEIAKERADENYSHGMTRRYPILWRLYENSLTLSLMLFFIAFFLVHAYGSLNMINEDRQLMGQSTLALWQVFKETEFWFESLQNWQSEFFSIAVMGLMSIFLRQKGSPQSKRLLDSNWKTGGH